VRAPRIALAHDGFSPYSDGSRNFLLKTGPFAVDEAVAGTALAMPADQTPPAMQRFKTIWTAQQGTAGGGAFAFVLAGYGDARVAMEFARGFRRERTIYALQPPIATAETTANLHDVIEEYTASLRRCQPSGPYHLGGYSAGGLMALEIARRLSEQGEDVRLLAILDPLFAHYRHLAIAGFNVMKRAVDGLHPSMTRRLRILRILTAMVRDEALAFHLRALNGHRPAPYRGRIDLFWTRTPFPLRPPRALAEWRAIGGGGLVVHQAPGTHHSFMRPPHVHQLAQALDAMIDAPSAQVVP
jgi:thioesterase domain-containing protein